MSRVLGLRANMHIHWQVLQQVSCACQRRGCSAQLGLTARRAARAADVAQVCLGPQTACTPGQPGVTLRNLTVGADGAVFHGPAAFLRPVGFAERAVFQRGVAARLEPLPPFERRVPLNAIPHGARPRDTPLRPVRPVLWR